MLKLSMTVYVYDPTINDPLSKVRGVGRYLQILREIFSREFIFTGNLKSYSPTVLKSSILINPFFNFLQPPLSIRRIAKKQVAVIHDIIPLKYPEHFPAGLRGNINIVLNQFALRNYDVIITDSEASKKDIVDLLHVKESKVKVVYPSLPKIFTKNNRHPERSEGSSANALFSNKLRDSSVASLLQNDKAPNSFCLYVGDATWNKNLVNLAKAIKKINVACVFVGAIFKSDQIKKANQDSPLHYIHPWQRELKAFLNETIGDKRFIFTGFLPDEELIKLYQQARLNILPSQDEGFGFSYLEAASLGCPSVLANIPVLKEISDGRGTVFANPKNPDELANAIGEIYFNSSVRQTLGSEAKQRVKFFSQKQFKESFLSCIQ